MSNVLPDPDSAFGHRIRSRLRDEQVVWLTTIGADGTPQPNPVWFLWDEDEPDLVLVYNDVKAARLGHVAARVAGIAEFRRQWPRRRHRGPYGHG